MSALKLLTISISLLLLSACSSQPVSIQYYLLHTPDDGALTQAPPQPVRLANLTVSDYLLQRGMAMQTKENTLHISAQHIWAEPFETGFKKKLTHALSPDYLISHSRVTASNALELDIEVLHLVATFQGDVVIDVRYSVKSSASSSVNRQFRARLPLQTDGYSHAVSVYRQAITLLAEDMKTHISTL